MENAASMLRSLPSPEGLPLRKIRRNSGFSLIEVVMIIALIMIGSSVALVQMRQSVATLDADRAAGMVVSQIQYARQVAVDQRRNVVIAYADPNQITVTRQDPGGVATELSDVTLPTGYTFGLASGVGDTPDGYGDDAAVDFNDGASATFLGDGTLVTGGGVVVNGTVFTIGAGNGSARAVTVTGASGRTKQYYLQGAAWVER
jgi:Tfp pilus assembly protein FimT